MCVYICIYPFLELTKMKITYMWILLTCVGVTSCISHVCDGYSQWVYISAADHPGISKDKLTGHNISYYTSLETAMKVKNLNDTCIVVEENINLKEDIVKKNIFKFLLTSNSNSSIQITCDNQRSVGIAFYKSTNILISNLHFIYCGGNRLMKRTCEGGNCLNILTSLYFHGSVNISVNNVCLNSNFGYGLSIVDSNVVRLNNVNVKNSNNFQLENIIQREHVGGGGLYVEYSPNYHAHKHILQLTNCIFVDNNASNCNLTSSDKTLPFCKGGGITLLYFGNSRENIFNCSDCIFNNNTAINGGGVYLYFSEHAENNSVMFENTSFLYNSAFIGGGIFSIVDNDTLNIYSSEIKNEKKSNGRILCRNCQFKACKGLMGAAMYFKRMSVFFEDLSVEESQKMDGYKRKGHGAVYVLDSFINLYGYISIRHNKGTGLVLNYSKVRILNKTVFTNNTGYNGGAVSLYGQSQIILLRDTFLKFIDNSAKNKGGAIYYKMICEPLIGLSCTEFLVNRCFISFEDGSQNSFNGSVIFINNSVETGFGKDIFSTTLKYCNHKNDFDLKQVIAEWTNFHFLSKDENIIVTDPTHMNFSNSLPWKNIYPGKSILPVIYLNDERGNHVQAEAIINFSNNVCIEQNKGLIVGNNRKIQLRLLGNENTRYNITIKTTSGMYLSRTLENLILKFCPFGFKYGKKVRKCICDYEHNRAHGIAECNENQLFMYHNQWIPTYINNSKPNENLSGYSCPAGYCRDCNTTNRMKIYCNYDKENQCQDGRDQSSRLCSKCESGKSVTMGGSQKCEDCRGTYGWIWISLAIFFGLSLFIIFLILLKLDIMSYYIGGCLYSYQILFSLYAPSQLHPKEKFLPMLTGIFEFAYLNSVYPESCLFDGMNNLHKLAYNYIIPFWMITFSMLIYHISSEDRNSLFTKSKCLHAFTIVGLMIYTDLTKNSFMILDWMVINGTKHPYLYADSVYGKGEHLPYFITAIVIIVLFTFCIPMYFLKSALKRLRQSNRQPVYHSLEYNFSYFLRKDCYWFLSYYFVSRIVIFQLAIFVQDGPFQTATLTMVCLVVFIFFSVVSPYVEPNENYAESFLLALLTVIGILNLGLQAVYSEKHITIIHQAIQVLSCVPIFVVPLKVLHEIVCKFCSKEENTTGELSL